MEQAALYEVEKTAEKKSKLFDESLTKYLLRAILASGFIGFGILIAFKTGNLFYTEHSPAAYPIAAITFGSAILLIAFAGGDLFTGNTFYFTYSALNKKMKWSKVLKMWTATYSGNLIGAISMAALIVGSGIFATTDTNEFLMSVVSGKMNTGTTELFIRAILCNWLVCLAFYVPMTLKNEMAKIFIMMFFVFGFFITGCEHSIANMGTFAIALLLDHPDTISLTKAVMNIVPVTLGNIVGGALFMAVLYKYLNTSKKSSEKDSADTVISINKG